MDDQNNSHAAPTAAPEVTPAPAPEMVNGVKVYPTSYMPAKTVLQTPKPALVEMHILHIEGIHIAMFLIITVILFIGMWKRPGLR